MSLLNQVEVAQRSCFGCANLMFEEDHLQSQCVEADMKIVRSRMMIQEESKIVEVYPDMLVSHLRVCVSPPIIACVQWL